MREFIYYSRTAPTAGNYIKDDLMDSGRLDIAIHSVISAFFLSHNLRADTKLHLVFAGPPDPVKHLEILPETEGKTGIDKIYLNKKDIGKTIKKMLYKYHKGEKKEVFPGYWIEKKPLLKLVEELSEQNKALYILDPKGEDIRKKEIKPNPVFVLGDHKGLPDKELKRLKKICEPVTIGKKTYFASHTIAIVNNEIDRRESEKLRSASEEEKQKPEGVAVFIDGRNFYHSTKRFKDESFQIKLQDVVYELVGKRELINVYYYNALLDKEHNSQTYKMHNEFLDILRNIPKFKVILCDVRKMEKEDGSFSYEVKGDDIYLAHDLLIGAFDNSYDTAIILSGDADFIPVINTIRKRFKKKIGNGFFRRTPSYKLRQSCDFSVNLGKIIRKLKERQK